MAAEWSCVFFRCSSIELLRILMESTTKSLHFSLYKFYHSNSTSPLPQFNHLHFKFPPISTFRLQASRRISNFSQVKIFLPCYKFLKFKLMLLVLISDLDLIFLGWWWFDRRFSKLEPSSRLRQHSNRRSWWRWRRWRRRRGRSKFGSTR